VADLNLPSLVSDFGDRSYLVPPIAALGALLWLTPLRRLAGTAVALLAILWLVVAFTPVTSWLAQGLVRRDPVEAADAVFVFASRVQEDGDPTTDAMSRLLKGVELVAEGRAPRLLVSELRPPAGPYAPLARKWLDAFARRGEVVSVGRIVNTHDEAVAAARLCRERGWTRVLAVTSPTHTRRASAALEKEGLAVIAVPSVETRFDLERLHWPGDRREAFSALAHERIGLVVYKRRGWIE
jgi:uncharacterized SAM-binding protein YcdF (DUF218 family)